MAEDSTTAWEYNVETSTNDQQRVDIEFCAPEALIVEDSEEEVAGAKPSETVLPPPRAVTDSPSFFSGLMLSLSGDNDEGTDDEEASVLSVAYFEPTDFNSNYWGKSMDAPTIGFAVAGLAMAITHPLLFIAGLATAWGTATAASQCHDCVSEPTWWSFLSSEVIENAGVSEKDDESTKEPSLSSEDTERKGEQQAEPHADAEVPEQLLLTQEQSEVPTGNTMLSKTEDQLPDNWLEIHYPKLKKTVVTDEEFVGLNVLEFVKVFFADDAPYHFKEFQKKRGDLNIQYGLWEDCKLEGHISIHPPALAPDFPVTDYHLYQTRLLTFKAKANSSSLLGPPYATTTKTQRLLILSKGCAVLEMKTSLRDIPFSDRFFVLERWVMNATKDSRGLYTTRLTVQTGVVFTASCPFENMIRSKSASAVSDAVQAWCRMAQQALLWTEKAKRDRILHADDATSKREEDEQTFTENAREDEFEYQLRDYDAASHGPSLPLQTEPAEFRKTWSVRNSLRQLWPLQRSPTKV